MHRIVGLVAVLFCSTACDREGKETCNWVLEAEPKLIGAVEKNYIPVCARNRVSMRQDCRLQAKLEFAREAEGKKFRYVDLKVDSPGIPRTVTGIEFCNSEAN